MLVKLLALPKQFLVFLLILGYGQRVISQQFVQLFQVNLFFVLVGCLDLRDVAEQLGASDVR